MQCPACGHNAATADFGSPAKCPACGAYYEKALSARAKRSALAGVAEAAVQNRTDIRGKFIAKLRMLVWSWKFWAVMLFFVFASWSTVVVKERQAERAAKYAAMLPAKPREPASISPYAYTKYTRESYPKTYEAWGESGVQKIAELERRSAQHVANSSGCNRVETVSLSQFRSYPPREPVVFVDCENGNRFFIGQKELGMPADALIYKKVY